MLLVKAALNSTVYILDIQKGQQSALTLHLQNSFQKHVKFNRCLYPFSKGFHSQEFLQKIMMNSKTYLATREITQHYL